MLYFCTLEAYWVGAGFYSVDGKDDRVTDKTCNVTDKTCNVTWPSFVGIAIDLQTQLNVSFNNQVAFLIEVN